MTKDEFREYYLGCDDKELVMQTAKEIKADGLPITVEEIEGRIRMKRSKKRTVIKDKTEPEPLAPEEGQGSAEVSRKTPEPPGPAETSPELALPPRGKRGIKPIMIVLPLIVILAAASFFGIRMFTHQPEPETNEWVDISDDIEYSMPDGYKESGKSSKYISLTNGNDSIYIQKSKHYDGSLDYYIDEYDATPAKAGKYSGYEYTKDSEYFFIFEKNDHDYKISSNNQDDCKAVIKSISFKK